MMDRKQSKTLKGLQLNIFQKNNTQINMTIKSPHDGKGFQWSSVEHNDKHHGKDKARTHNNLFNYFKGVLEANGLWKDIGAKLGKITNNQGEEIDLDNKYGFIYITTNLVNGMKYVGKHTNFGDDYLGSGTEFKKAVEDPNFYNRAPGGDEWYQKKAQ